MASSEPDKLQPRNLYALIIGINRYPSREGWSNLNGAINDAQNFRNLLKEWGVPETNIEFLTDSTRAKMASALRTLKAGRLETKTGSIRLPKDCAFVLFYAGHGGRTRIPHEWVGYSTPDEQVEQLIPSDIGTRDGHTNRVVEGIPDRTIAAVLDGLAGEIGDNITVIFDCCHSMGATRAPSQDEMLGESLLHRALPNLPPLSGDCDADIIEGTDHGPGWAQRTRGGISGPGDGTLRGGKRKKSLEYMLLAACQQDQRAWDRSSGGVFTTELIRVLRENFSHRGLDSLTYAGLFLRMKMPHHLQTPACFGVNQNRIIFTRKAGKPTHDYFIGQNYPSSNSNFVPIIYGGLAHGIRNGDTFEIFDITAEGKRLGKATVMNTFAASAELQLHFSLAENTTFYCRLVREYNSWKVFFDSENEGLLSKVNTEQIKFQQTKSRKNAMAIIERNKSRQSCVQFSFGTGWKNVVERNKAHSSWPQFSFGLESRQDGNNFREEVICTPYVPVLKNRPSEIRGTLVSMFRLRSLLGMRDNIPKDWKDIDICFQRVIKVTKESSNNTSPIKSTYQPCKTRCHSMNAHGKTVMIPVQKSSNSTEKEYYGLTIRNGSNRHLFAYIICIEPRTLFIEPWYSSTYFTPDVPFHIDDEDELQVASGLKPDKSLPIGYGNSGVDPYTFSVPRDLTEDCTYLRVILTSNPADFSMLMQTDNPLEALGAMDPAMVRYSTSRSVHREGSHGNQRRLQNVARSEQSYIKREKSYYSVTLAVRQYLKTSEKWKNLVASKNAACTIW